MANSLRVDPNLGRLGTPGKLTGSHENCLPLKTQITVKTLNIGTPRLTTVVVLNIKQFNFTMQ